MIILYLGLKGMYKVHSFVSRSVNNARGKASASHYLSIDERGFFGPRVAAVALNLPKPRLRNPETPRYEVRAKKARICRNRNLPTPVVTV